MAGTQATELLVAVQRVPYGVFASRKKQRLGSDLKSLQSARRSLRRSTSGQAGSGHRSITVVLLWVRLTRSTPAPWCWERMSTLVGAGLLEAATAMPRSLQQG